MTSLGSFGAAMRELDPAAEKATFELCGETFTVTGLIPPILMLHLGAALAGKVGDVDGNAAMWTTLRCALSEPEQVIDGKAKPGDDAQFNRFYLLAVRKCVALGELINLAWALVGAQSGKADEPPADSPAPSPGTSTLSSGSVSDSPDSGRLVSVDEALGG